MVTKVSGLTIVLAVSLCGAANADLSISNKPTQNMSCDAGICTATAKKAVLNVSDLQAMLANGDVAVKTGSVANDVDIVQPLTWANASRLTLDAQHSVTVKKQITVAGSGDLTVMTNDGGQNGEFIIEPKARVQFWDLSSSLIIDGNAYTLVNDIKTLAANIAASPSDFYALAKSYDASVDGTYNASPIGQLKSRGVIEGLGNSISNLSISSTKSTALLTKNSGALLDLGVSGTISSASSKDRIYVGGLAARNSGRITNCSFSGSVDGKTYSFVGALAAKNTGAILRSRAAGTVHGIIAGGIAGASDGLISLSQASATISGGSAGGLVGYSGGLIDRSFATGSVSGTTNGGGLVGNNYSASISNSYATGSVTADFGGGLIGGDDSAVTSSYSTGSISPGQGEYSLGGLVGIATAATFSNAYWDIETSSQSEGCGWASTDCSNVTGLSDAQLKSGLPKGFNPEIWASDPNINNGYPYLLANPPQ